ncbi:MAG TPA: PDZ domain-containing protein, partial [Pyrinomonadaceae bacterium]|nr:PDZ domain-containing protein [Pyrinomonadaceae bacterium]
APPAPAAPAASLFEGGNFLGVHPEDLTAENVARYGLRGERRGVGVRSVVKGSPAERAGLRDGDVILRFDGEPVASVRKLNRLIAEAPPEHRARLSVLRGGSEHEIAARLGRREFASGSVGFGQAIDGEAARRMAEELRRNSEEWQRRGQDWGERLEELQRDNPGGLMVYGAGGRRIGVSVNPLSKQLAEYFGVTGGVLVETVAAGSPAERAGLKAGDVITEADGEKLDGAGGLSRVINRRQEGEVTLTLYRDRRQRTVRVTPEKREPTFVGPGEFRLVRPGVSALAPRPLRRALAAPEPPRVRPSPVAPPRLRARPGGRAI